MSAPARRPSTRSHVPCPHRRYFYGRPGQILSRSRHPSHQDPLGPRGRPRSAVAPRPRHGNDVPWRRQRPDPSGPTITVSETSYGQRAIQTSSRRSACRAQRAALDGSRLAAWRAAAGDLRAEASADHIRASQRMRGAADADDAMVEGLGTRASLNRCLTIGMNRARHGTAPRRRRAFPRRFDALVMCHLGSWTPRSRQIILARWSLTSRCRGTAERRRCSGLCHQECRPPYRRSSQPCDSR